MPGELISNIPIHDPNPPSTSKMELDNAGVSEYCTLSEMLNANFATIQRGKLIVVTTTNASFNLASQFGFTPAVLIIEGWGAGGSGASGVSGTARGSGGGGGQYFRHYYSGTMDTTLDITIGAGGIGVNSSGSTGTAGGNTTVVGTNLGTLTANGGIEGTAGTNSNGGAGGSGTTDATFAQNGEDGGSGVGGTTAFGYGGSSPFGGQGSQQNVNTGGYAPGGGGSGGNHVTAFEGGNGGAGQVNIWAS